MNASDFKMMKKTLLIELKCSITLKERDIQTIQQKYEINRYHPGAEEEYQIHMKTVAHYYDPKIDQLRQSYHEIIKAHMNQEKIEHNLKNVKTVSRKKLESQMAETCSICQEEHKMADVLQTSCGHHFGQRCFDSWKTSCIENNHAIKCPNCNLLWPGRITYRYRYSKEPIFHYNSSIRNVNIIQPNVVGDTYAPPTCNPIGEDAEIILKLIRIAADRGASTKDIQTLQRLGEIGFVLCPPDSKDTVQIEMQFSPLKLFIVDKCNDVMQHFTFKQRTLVFPNKGVSKLL